MAEYLSPAVYVEEISSGIKPLQGVGTSTAGFVGLTAMGPIGGATPINNFSEFQRKFGGYWANGLLPYAVSSFFNEGGGSCYVVRTCHYDSDGKATAVVASIADEYKALGDPTKPSLAVSAASAGAWGNDLAVSIQHTEDPPGSFTLQVFQAGVLAATYPKLSMDRTSANYVATKINGVSPFLSVRDRTPADSNLDAAGKRPNPTTANRDPLTKGADGLADLAAADFVANGLNKFDAVDEVNIIAVPEQNVPRDVHGSGLAYCEKRQDCFYIADGPPSFATADDMLNYKSGEAGFAGNAISSKYGALYAPWIQVFDPRTSGRIAIPPSGAVAGRYAAVDGTRGVHKAPAGVVAGKLNSALGVTFDFVRADQEKLNPAGVNVIRNLPGTGPVIWGARTVSSDPEWRHLNVRRLFIFLRESILSGTNWVVFEPNDRSLWKSIERNVGAFLRLQWLAGALVGATADEAFYVKCDEETNPPERILLGQVTTEIGVAPSKPAEFVIFRIMQTVPGGAA